MLTNSNRHQTNEYFNMQIRIWGHRSNHYCSHVITTNTTEDAVTSSPLVVVVVTVVKVIGWLTLKSLGFGRLKTTRDRRTEGHELILSCVPPVLLTLAPNAWTLDNLPQAAVILCRRRWSRVWIRRRRSQSRWRIAGTCGDRDGSWDPPSLPSKDGTSSRSSRWRRKSESDCGKCRWGREREKMGNHLHVLLFISTPLFSAQPRVAYCEAVFEPQESSVLRRVLYKSKYICL